MKIIGVSGGSGAGKTTTAKMLANMLPNSLFVDADYFARVITDRSESKIFEKLGVKKNSNELVYNTYFTSFEAMTTWIDVIKDDVSKWIDEHIEKEGIGKDYIVVDWCYLPMCDFFKKCDYTVCVKMDYEARFNRLAGRLQEIDKRNEDKGLSEEKGYNAYLPWAFENRVKFSDISEYGFKSQYEVNNDGNIKDLEENVKKYVDEFIKR